MRAERLFLFFALSLFGIALIRPEVLLPAPFDFIQASHADPLLNQQLGAQADPPKTKSAAVDHEVPVFVPDHQTLRFASDREAEPDAKSKAPTASLDAQPKTSEWPEFIGAKKLFGAVKEPAPLAARAIGTYARGCLSGAVALPIGADRAPAYPAPRVRAWCWAT